MNISTYVFGKFEKGYRQFPDDYTKSIFQTFKDNGKARTQIAMHRNGDLMYYGYIRLLDGNNYIGLCVVINGYYITDLSKLFDVFQNVIEMMVREGYLIHFNDQREIVASATHLVEDKEAFDEIKQSLSSQFENLDNKILPAVSYEKSSNSIKSFSIQDPLEDVVRSSFSEGYTLLYKSSGYETYSVLSYKGVVNKLSEQIKSLEAEKKSLSINLNKQKRKQKNTKWVSVLSIIAVVFGFIIWNKVLYPDEVTKYDAGEFLYYGPMEDGKPNGTGVAIYPKNDKDKRLYYYGNFTSGKRVDSNAIMFYRDGSYFRGSMDDDHWNKGTFYDVGGDYFEGTFKNNNPFEGKWYKHVFAQSLTGDE